MLLLVAALQCTILTLVIHATSLQDSSCASGQPFCNDIEEPASAEHPSWAHGAGCAPLASMSKATQKKYKNRVNLKAMPKGSELFVCYDGHDVAALEKNHEFKRPCFAEGSVVLVENFLTAAEVAHMRNLTRQSIKRKKNDSTGTSLALVLSDTFRNHPHLHLMRGTNEEGGDVIESFDDKIVNRVEQRIGKFLKVPPNMHERLLQLSSEAASDRSDGPLKSNFHQDKNGEVSRHVTAILYLSGGPAGPQEETLRGGETIFPALTRRRPESEGGAQKRGKRQRRYSMEFQRRVIDAMDAAPPLSFTGDIGNWPALDFDGAEGTPIFSELMDLCKNASSVATFEGVDGEGPVLAVAPIPGRAIFFWSEGPSWQQGAASGEILPDMWHGGCPVLRGRKEFMQKFKSFDLRSPECNRHRWCSFIVHKKKALFEESQQQ